MSQAQSGKHGVRALKAKTAPSSRLSVRGAFPWDVVWAVGLCLASFGDALVVGDRAALERFSALFDQPAVAWCGAALGYACIAASASTTVWRDSPIGSRSLTWLALLAFSYHLWLLRWPWLVEAALPGSRLEVSTAVLSQTWQGLPLYAFARLLAEGLLYTHAAAFLFSETCRRGLLAEPRLTRLGARVIGLTALTLFCIPAWATVNLATGR